MPKFQFKRFFSLDSAKAVKARSFGYLNAINYMSPASSGGFGNLCPHASPGCIALCLGLHSGQAAMVSHATGTNAVRESRKRKAQSFMRDRVAFMREAAVHIARHARYASGIGLKLCVRLNGATDVAWEGVRVQVDVETAKLTGKPEGTYSSLYALFPEIQFVDYTKNPLRFNRPLPANIHLTFSRSETNDATAIELLTKGINVAVVFASGLPAQWNGFQVIDGDEHDLRHLDPRGGFVVGLSPKGNKAKRDTSGFILRDYAMAA
jgi:hypothetical protein